MRRLILVLVIVGTQIAAPPIAPTDPPGCPHKYVTSIACGLHPGWCNDQRQPRPACYDKDPAEGANVP